MDWFDQLTSKAESAWNEVTDTAEDYVAGRWESAREQMMSNGQVQQQNTAAIPGAQDSTQSGQGVTASEGAGQSKPFNWQAAGVIVGLAGILMKVMK
jgi:hypothetical protein